LSSGNTNSLQDISDGIVEVVNKVSPSVVQVSNGRRGYGSGVVWDNEGRILTNAHVIGRATSVEVAFSDDGGKSYQAKVLGQDRFSDVALLQIEGAEKTKLQPISRGDSAKLSTGQFVLALANPFGEKVSATFGIVTNASATLGGRMPWSDNVIVTDAKLNPGYSGGPLVDASGKMVGMNAAYFANRGIAIPVSSLVETAKNLSVEGGIKRAYLGIVSDTISLPEEVAEEIKQEEGLIVYSVESGTPAKKGGVAVGDIVVKLNSKPVTNFYDLRRLLTSEVIGKPTVLSVLRGEKLTELTVTPTEA
jgi:S1-C subfamily serine protease